MSSIKKKTMVDLFAGAGGLSCGLEMAGFHPVLANEFVPEYAKTYSYNHPKTDVVIGDIRELSETNIRKKLGVDKEEIDLLAGGPPCQGFSINAPTRTLDDDRNHLFKEYIKRTRGTFVQNVLDELHGLWYWL